MLIAYELEIRGYNNLKEIAKYNFEDNSCLELAPDYEDKWTGTKKHQSNFGRRRGYNKENEEQMMEAYISFKKNI